MTADDIKNISKLDSIRSKIRENQDYYDRFQGEDNFSWKAVSQSMERGNALNAGDGTRGIDFVGKNLEHIKLELVDNTSGKVLNGIAFNMAQYFDYIKSGKKWKPVSQHEAVKVKTDDVLKVQAFLNKIGWEELDEDGKLGAKTREAIKKVQKKARMPQDGYPDYQFLQKINNYNPKVGFSVPVQPKKSAKPDVQKKKQSLRTDKNKLN